MRSNFTSSVKLFKKPGNGQVKETINQDQPGRVKWKASYWPAQFYQTEAHVSILPGEQVQVVGRQGITLLVMPEKN